MFYHIGLICAPAAGRSDFLWGSSFIRNAGKLFPIKCWNICNPQPKLRYLRHSKTFQASYRATVDITSPSLQPTIFDYKYMCFLFDSVCLGLPPCFSYLGDNKVTSTTVSTQVKGQSVINDTVRGEGKVITIVHLTVLYLFHHVSLKVK